jgi:hypothetical protein
MSHKPNQDKKRRKERTNERNLQTETAPALDSAARLDVIVDSFLDLIILVTAAHGCWSQKRIKIRKL